MGQKAMLIFNPKAGMGGPAPPIIKALFGLKQRKKEFYRRNQDLLNSILKHLNNRDICPEVKQPSSAEESCQEAKRAVSENYDLIIAMGGDGTINEIINGIAGSNVSLGVIQIGTANVFSMQMDLPVEIEEACEVITRGKTMWMDLGRCNGRYFACMSGVGYDAYVVKMTHSKLKKVLGAFAYVLVALWNLMFYKFRPIKIELENQNGKTENVTGYFLLVCNGKYYAGNKVLATQADYTDGLLDVCLFKTKNLLNLYWYLFGIKRDNIYKYLNMSTYQSRHIKVSKRGRHSIHVDGEYIGRTPAEIVVVSNALKVIV